MKIFYLEDHEFFASEVIEYLIEEGHDVHYAVSYKEAERIISKEGPFECSLLDVLLQNGKTGVLLAEEHGDELGRKMFITGTPDKSFLDAIEKHCSASKYHVIYDKIEEFLAGGSPKIDRSFFGSQSGGYDRK